MYPDYLSHKQPNGTEKTGVVLFLLNFSYVVNMLAETIKQPEKNISHFL